MAGCTWADFLHGETRFHGSVKPCGIAELGDFWPYNALAQNAAQRETRFNSLTINNDALRRPQ
jgi:hypothetical protein